MLDLGGQGVLWLHLFSLILSDSSTYATFRELLIYKRGGLVRAADPEKLNSLWVLRRVVVNRALYFFPALAMGSMNLLTNVTTTSNMLLILLLGTQSWISLSTTLVTNTMLAAMANVT